MNATQTKLLNATVVVSALGYFVDIYDLLLFSIVRVASLKDIGVPAEELLPQGVKLINMQMIGLLIGGIIWGVWGDKRGRLSVLFGSIFLYSVANIANAFVHDVNAYAFWRFVAGVGLAGELGAAITLVSEVMTKEQRGYGTTIVASFGILGAVAAGIVGDYFSWRTAFIVGGVMGLCLLVLRISLFESGMFESVKEKTCPKGDLKMLLFPFVRFVKYLRCILIGAPLWFVIGILITFSPELAKELGVSGPISSGSAVLFSYLGLSVGDLASGYLSQVWRSRKKVIAVFLAITTALVSVYVFGASGWSVTQFYVLCVALGFAVGYWAVFVTTAAEHFGTNLRATVATTVPNFVRGSLVIFTLCFQSLKPEFGLLHSAFIVGMCAIAVAFVSLFGLEETYGKDLDYLEQ
jgi:putative MFS transporter